MSDTPTLSVRANEWLNVETFRECGQAVADADRLIRQLLSALTAAHARAEQAEQERDTASEGAAFFRQKAVDATMLLDAARVELTTLRAQLVGR